MSITSNHTYKLNKSPVVNAPDTPIIRKKISEGYPDRNSSFEDIVREYKKEQNTRIEVIKSIMELKRSITIVIPKGASQFPIWME